VNPDKRRARREGRAPAAQRRRPTEGREIRAEDREDSAQTLHGSIGNAPCAIAKTLDIVGEPWTMLVLREAFWGVRRFSDFQASLKIPKATLAERLAKLVKHSLLRKEIYQESGARPREEYRLTSKAVDLIPALVALMQWGYEHLGVGNIDIVDRRTGSPLKVGLVDEKGALIHPRDTKAVLKKR
jgi:DNA-binding HxlR family transcriptional regulator